ncbi:hypothetical protein [Yinghuangia sp. YIM S10712]|uniref:hypothetical protein n=1 Tax=Yinghuangia sp. YIM S10712 TaxID=3436930 RepID=UPI003F52A6B5
MPLLRPAGALPGDWRDDRTPRWTPQGRAIPTGPWFETFQEALALIGAGKGAFIVGAQAARFYTRPDVAYVPLADAPPLDWVPTWLTTNNTPRIHAFIRTAQEITAKQAPDKPPPDPQPTP